MPIPLVYALLGNASIAVISFLFMTHIKRREDMPLDFGDMIQSLAKIGKSAPFVRDFIRAQRTHLLIGKELRSSLWVKTIVFLL